MIKVKLKMLDNSQLWRWGYNHLWTISGQIDILLDVMLIV